jgi:hypothetical protein
MAGTTGPGTTGPGTVGPGTKGPTGPGGGTAAVSQQEYERGFNHGYFAGMRACSSGQAPAKPCCCPQESALNKFLLGLALGFIPALLMGLFMGLFLAHSFKP